MVCTHDSGNSKDTLLQENVQNRRMLREVLGDEGGDEK